MSSFGFRRRANELLARAETSLVDRGWDTAAIGSVRQKLGGSQVPRGMPGDQTARTNLALGPGETLEVELLPGYAALRGSTDEPRLDVLVQGRVTKSRPIERASRSQRIFMSATKSLVGLAKLPTPVDTPNVSRTSSSDSAALGRKVASVSLAARPDIAAGPAGLDGRPDPKNAAYEQLLDLSDATAEPEDLETQLEQELAELGLEDTRPTPSRTSTLAASDTADLETLHQNLRHRLRGFLAQPLEGRHVRVTVSDAGSGEAMATGLLLTGEEGTFKHVLPIQATAQRRAGLKLRVTAELQLESAEGHGAQGSTAHRLKDDSTVQVYQPGALRVVSDCDDTIKHTEVLASTRTLLRNVLTLPYSSVTVPGMREWYSALDQLGAGFHYVSNAPTQFATVIKEFFEAAKLPTGSLTLKQYAKGSGLLSGLWTPAGARKRQNVEAILTAFPDSPFVLIGDSGEQDLELYCELAATHPQQVLAVFIRDVTTSTFPASRAPSGRSRSGSPDSDEDDLPLTVKSAKARLQQPIPAPEMTSDMTYDGPDDALSPNNPLASQAVSPRQKLLAAFHARLALAQQRLPDGCVLRIFKDGHEVREEALELVKSALSARR